MDKDISLFLMTFLPQCNISEIGFCYTTTCCYSQSSFSLLHSLRQGSTGFPVWAVLYLLFSFLCRWLGISKMFSTIIVLILGNYIDVRVKTPLIWLPVWDISAGIPRMKNTNMSSIDHTCLPFIPDKNGHVLAWKPGGFLQYLVFYSLHLFFFTF